jgi:tetratricopeptide (TPR) repeat protein
VRFATISLVCSVVVAATAPALAENKAVAREAYAEGTKFYDLNEFDKALTEFRRAYLNYEEPSFLFNIAQCHRALGNGAEAIKFYRSYLRKSPNASNRDDVLRLISTLEASIAKAKEAATIPPKDLAPPAEVKPIPPAPEPKPAAQQPTPAPVTVTTREAPASTAGRAPLYKKWWLWTTVGLVAAGAAVGIGVGVSLSQSSPAFSPTLPDLVEQSLVRF